MTSLQPKPDVGTKIQCNPSLLTTLNSNVPIIRVSCTEGNWAALNPDEKTGLIVFLEGDADPVDFSAIEIVKVGERVAFAVCCNSV